jgi:hypothetical protein
MSDLPTVIAPRPYQTEATEAAERSREGGARYG